MSCPQKTGWLVMKIRAKRSPGDGRWQTDPEWDFGEKANCYLSYSILSGVLTALNEIRNVF